MNNYNDPKPIPMSSGALGASIPSGVSEIENCLNASQNETSRLHMRIDSLSERLRPVMGAIGQTVSGRAGVPHEALSPLGESIRGLNDQIENAVERLESILSNLAL